ncbi:hemagglutinin repeat-containing protein [Moraxella cuniculi]|uniref:Filamentous hemagglutinin n=1 Tax=Moraxella cuniculi TaxID=34061 RepID=A0A448GX83_9GAMM|nr:hemagglutinin repeat-containing protein [Moraxella cuniculi]VEG13331.1 Filamentous hemagglutinin [Moraxella cuniculi]
MNHIYKIVFNKSTQTWMAVCEYARGVSCNSVSAGNKPSIKGMMGKVTALSFVLLCLLQSAHANTPTTILADKSADKSLQPIVLLTASGITSVNITTPNARGLSNNHYSQFDVGNSGVILNNNRQATNTQIAGFVAANPFMARGEASTILNQINSNHPSYLGGFIEIAGKKADVIIANPSGLVVNGAGLINAGNAHLAAAGSEVNQGQVSGYQVGGDVLVLGTGLDNRQVDFTQVIARHVQLDAPIVANELQLITSNGYIDTNGTTTSTSAQGKQITKGRTIAVDIGELGGVYAGKITLISSEIDTLVNNQGQIFSGLGGLQLDIGGNLVNTGTISSQGKATLVAKDAINSGTVSSKEQLTLVFDNLDNAGTVLTTDEVKAQVVNTISNQSSAQINAQRLNVQSNQFINDGTITQTGTQALSVIAQGKLTNLGDIGKVDTVAIDTMPTPDTPSAPISPKETTVALPSSATDQGISQITSSPPQNQNLATGIIKTINNLDNLGKIQANGGVDLTAISGLDNTGKLNVRHLKASGDALTNTADIQASTTDIYTNTVNNNHGKLTASHMLSITTDQLNNTKGKLHSAKDSDLQVSQQITNTQGEILANGLLNIHDNNQNSLTVINADGTLLAQDLSIQAKSLSNTGELSAANDLSLQLTDDLQVQRDLQAGNTLTINTQGSIDNQKTIQAGFVVDIFAKDIINQGTINSNKTTYLQSQKTLLNIGTGKIYGDHVALAANTLSNTDTDNASAIIAAYTRLDIGADKIINKTQRKTLQNSDSHSKLLSEGTLHIGGSLDDNHQAVGKATSLENLSTNIESGGDMFIAAAKTTNDNLHLETAIHQIGDIEEKHTISFSNRTSSEHGPGDWGWNLKDKLPDEYEPSKFRFDGLKHIYLDNEDGSTVGLGRIWIENYDKLRHFKTLVKYTDPSVIKSGGSIRFDGDVDNLDSTILAQDDILATSTNINNISTKGVSYTLRDRQSTHRDWYHDGGIGGSGYTRADLYNKTTNEKIHEKTFEMPTTVTLNQQSIDKPNSNAQTADITSKTANVAIATINTTLLPSSSLYTINPAHPDYLVQTDPAFVNYRKWLSSDYMLKALQSDPNYMHKQIGDGYYQQRLVAEQIAQLTGRNYLSDYQNQEEQFKALMDAGIEFAQAFNLAAGTALTAEQMSLLTKPMIWLQLKDIALEDGSWQRVYYPVVLLPKNQLTLQADGALIAARNIIVDGEIIKNKGTMLAKEDVILAAKDVYLSGGSLAAKRIRVLAEQNIHNQAKIDADESVKLHAGQDIYPTATAGLNSTSPAQIRVGDAKADTQANLILQAGRDITLANANISNESQAVSIIKADRNLNIGAVSTTHTQKTVWNQDNEQQQSKTIWHGSQIDTQGSLLLHSANELNITVNHTTQTESYSDRFYTKNKQTLSSSSAKSQSNYNKTTAVGSQITGTKVLLSANDNIQITSSQVVSDDGTSLNAGKDIRIDSATNTLNSQFAFSHDTSGLMSSGNIGVSIGKETISQDTVQNRTTQAGSTVGSLQGNTTSHAGNNYSQTASIISTPQGDTTITAKQVDITTADNTYYTNNQSKYKKKGLTFAVNVPIVNAAQATVNTAQTVGKSSNDRINAMAVANTGWQAYQTSKTLANTGKAISEIAKGNLKNANELAQISAAITYGEQQNTTQTILQGTTAEASQVLAGGTVTIQATDKDGTNSTSNINITGSNVLGRLSTQLTADNDIDIKAYEQYHSERSSNQSKGYNAGVAISYGKDGFAFGVTAGGNYGKGYGNADEVTYKTSHVGDSNSQTTITTGDKLTVQGGQVKGGGVTITANDLYLASTQDTATYVAKQQNIQAQAAAGYGASLNVNYSQSKINADYKSVTEQSGIFAGNDGFNININNHTQLDGAIITSTAKAEEQGKNSFGTGTLTITHFDNESHHEGDSLGVGAGVNFASKKSNQSQPNTKDVATKSKGMVSNSIGLGSDSGNQVSVTKGGIYTKNVVITDTANQIQVAGKSAQDVISNAKIEYSTDDFANNNWQAIGSLTNNFDADKVLKELNIQVKATQDFRENSFGVITEYADKKQANLREQIKQTTDETLKTQLYKEIYKVQYQRRLLETLVGSISGTPDVTITQGALQLAATKMREESLENSRQSPGFEDLGTGQAINNVSYDSGYFDGVKLGGTRLGTDIICGKDGSRCEKDPSNPEKFLINENGNYIFKPNDIYPNLQSFLNDKSKDAAGKLYGLTGGSQALSGTMFGKPYKIGGFVDLTTESFAGTHDYLGGQRPGYYDKDGNTKPGNNKGQGIVTGLAIPISAPFALADLITPDFMSIILKIAR